MASSNGTFYLYNAFYDNRKLSPIGPSIRILAMIDRNNPTLQTYCQLRFDNFPNAHVTKTFEYKYIWKQKWESNDIIYHTYLITCRIPKVLQQFIPSSVSIVNERCDTASNNLQVINNKPLDGTKQGFGVCVKGLDFLHSDISVRLVEWIELLHILGANKIYFYQLNVHPNIAKILQYYKEKDMIHVTPLTLAGGQPNIPHIQHKYFTEHIQQKRLNELIAYNDCFYKNMQLYDFIALLDVDEVIMPKKDMTWNQLLKRVLKKATTQHTSFYVTNTYFLDVNKGEDNWIKTIPKYMHMLQHVQRSANHSQKYYSCKSFFSTDKVYTLHNHHPLKCLGLCKNFPIDTDDAQLQHYRKDCDKFDEQCKLINMNTTEDTTIWRFKDLLVKRSNAALRELGFLKGK